MGLGELSALDPDEREVFSGEDLLIRATAEALDSEVDEIAAADEAAGAAAVFLIVRLSALIFSFANNRSTRKASRAHSFWRSLSAVWSLRTMA